MADQNGWLGIGLQLGDQLIDQVGPARCDRIGGVVRVHVERPHIVLLAQQGKELAVGTGRVAIGVRKVQQWFWHGQHNACVFGTQADLF